MIYLAAFCVTRSYFIFFYAVVIAVKVVLRSSLEHGTLHLICFDLLGAPQSSALICCCRIESCGAATIWNRNSSSSPRKNIFPLDTTNTSSIRHYPIHAQCPPYSNPIHLFIMYSKKWNDFFRLLEIPNCTMLGVRITWNRPKMPQFISVQWKEKKKTINKPLACTRSRHAVTKKKKKLIAFVHAYGKWKRTEFSECARADRPKHVHFLFSLSLFSVCAFFFLILSALALALAHSTIAIRKPRSRHHILFAVRFASCGAVSTVEYAVKWYTLDPLSRRVDCDLAACRHTQPASQRVNEWVQSGRSQVYWW